MTDIIFAEKKEIFAKTICCKADFKATTTFSFFFLVRENHSSRSRTYVYERDEYQLVVRNAIY